VEPGRYHIPFEKEREEPRRERIRMKPFDESNLRPRPEWVQGNVARRRKCSPGLIAALSRTSVHPERSGERWNMRDHRIAK
jgi:hypothetical protein